jgi:hypothetical protein
MGLLLGGLDAGGVIVGFAHISARSGGAWDKMNETEKEWKEREKRQPTLSRLEISDGLT